MTEASLQSGMRMALVGMAVNFVLAIVKLAAGFIGNSYALVADGIESSADILSSLIVWSGLRIAAVPADAQHPYGHGKAEPIAGLIVSLALLGAAILIAVESVSEILTPHHAPAPFTLVVLLLVVLTKEALFRSVLKTGEDLGSTAVQTDAWHHRSDAITSLAAGIGISVALIGGPGYEAADDWAALVACAIIAFNGCRLGRTALNELMDTAAPDSIVSDIRREALTVPGVLNIDKCRVIKTGLNYLVEIHVVVNGNLPVRQGHEIAHNVKDLLKRTHVPILDVIVHVEPDTR